MNASVGAGRSGAMAAVLRGWTERVGRARPLRAFAVLAAGAAVGLAVWRLTVPATTFHSFVFFNNLASAERRSLLLYLTLGALAFVAAWFALSRALPSSGHPGSPLERTGSWLSAGLLAGFLPFLAVPAMEVFHTWQVFALVAGFVGVTFLVARDVSRHARAPAVGSSSAGSAEDRLPRILLVLFTAGYAAFFIAHTLSRHHAFHSYALDLGWQHQAIHTLLATGNPVVTLWWFTLNHFGNHFQPLYYLLAPIYAIHQDATTLLVLQAVVLASAAVPIYLIARRRIGEPWVALLLATAYLLYPPLHGMNNYDFHGLVLLVPFACWLLYGLEIRSAPLFWVFFALGLITREDTAVSLSGIGMYLLLDRDRRRLGLAVLAACAGWFVIVLVSMSALDGYADLSNYWALTVPEQQGFVGVLLTLVTNPVYVLKGIFFEPGKLEYLVQILLPVAFLPLFAGRALLLMVPGLAIMLLSNTFFNYAISCPYSAHIVPAVFFLTILGIQAIRARRSTLRLPAIAAPLLAAALLMNGEFGLVFSKRFPGFVRPTQRQRTAYSFIEQVPRDASVATGTRLVPHLSARSRILLWQSPRMDADYILMDLAPAEPAIDMHEKWYQESQDPGPVQARAFAVAQMVSGGYGVVRFEDEFILLRKGYDPSANEATIRSVQSLPYGDRRGVIDYYRDPALDVDPPRYSASDLLAAKLEEHSSRTILLAAKGDAARNLSYLAMKYLLLRGSNINTLHPGGAYVAVLQGGVMVQEAIDNRRPVELSSASDPALCALLDGRELHLYSSGEANGSRVSIRLAGEEVALDRQGMNVVVLDSFGQVTDRAVYETGR